MHTHLLGSITLTAAGLLTAGLFAPQAAAHGGVYRGPGDTVPPGAHPPPSTGPPATGGGGAPAPQAPQGPTTPVGGGLDLPGVGGGGGSAPTTPDGFVDTSSDLTRWVYWWEFNKDPFLNLKAAIHASGPTTGDGIWDIGDGERDGSSISLAPTRAQVRDAIEPALREALASETNNDIVTGCLIALAKIGEARDENGRPTRSPSNGELIASFLDDPNQEISETAAIALGILGDDRRTNLDRLIALVTDTSAGRELVGGDRVALRTRAFAAYGLGLVGAASSDHETRVRVIEVLTEALVAAEREATQDIAAAIVISIGLVPLAADPIDADGRTLAERLERDLEGVLADGVDSLEDQVALLGAVFDDLRLDRYLRAHVPTALGRLLRSLDGRADLDAHRRELKAFVSELLLVPLDPRKGRKFEEEIQQSCALALGLVGDADGDPVDARIRERLFDASRSQQRQAQNFALVALAKIAARPGEEALGTHAVGVLEPDDRDALDDYRWRDARTEVAEHFVKRMSRGRSGEEHFAGMGAGVMGWLLRRNGDRLPTATALALLEELRDAKDVDSVGAFAVATGLSGEQDGRKPLIALIERTEDPTARGYVALALGLLGDRDSKELITSIVASSEYRPELLKQSAIALGLLGDKRTVTTLVDMLRSSRSLAAQAAIASALGFIGDRDSVTPLIEMLQDETKTASARGFAAAALGIVADRSPLPWNSRIGVDLNYRASVPTLNSTDGKGVLNLL